MMVMVVVVLESWYREWQRAPPDWMRNNEGMINIGDENGISHAIAINWSLYGWNEA